MTRLIATFLLLLACTSRAAERPNIIVILSDDHRYDFLGFMEGAPEFLETPNLDRMARGGAHLQNAFVSTSLCSPSRASILTGQYMHHHRVVDNAPVVRRHVRERLRTMILPTMVNRLRHREPTPSLPCAVTGRPCLRLVCLRHRHTIRPAAISIRIHRTQQTAF